MIVVANTESAAGAQKAVEVLRAGGSVIDAVEAGLRLVEDDPDDFSVGYGGWPSLLGEVELDAAIMDGAALTTGAVGAMRGYKHPISVARKVMENLPHVLLVGSGAERFAWEMGFESGELLTGRAVHEIWERHMQMEMSPENLRRLAARADLWRYIHALSDPAQTHGTADLIVRDDQGNLCVGVSTSGWPLKYPGRVGDSPIVGAGLYADNRYGAAACTGMGEMAMRACTARSVVLYLKMGLPLPEAGRQAMQDLNDLGGRYLSEMDFVVMDREGRHAGFTGEAGETYVYMTADMTAPEEVERTHVPLRKRWG